MPDYKRDHPVFEKVHRSIWVGMISTGLEDVHMGYEEGKACSVLIEMQMVGLQFLSQLNFQIINKIEI